MLPQAVSVPLGNKLAAEASVNLHLFKQINKVFCSELLCDLAVLLCPCRMMVFGVLTLILSWTSLGADLATAVVSCFTSSPLTDRVAPVYTGKLVCNQFLSHLTAMINCLNYTYTALEKLSFNVYRLRRRDDKAWEKAVAHFLCIN